MNVLRTIKRSIKWYKYVLAYDREKAKEFGERYINEIDFLESVNNNYFEKKVNELQKWSDASLAAFNLPQKGLKKLERKIKMKRSNNHISKLFQKMYLSAEVKVELEEIKLQFDRIIQLTNIRYNS